jgi:hypothetical protein
MLLLVARSQVSFVFGRSTQPDVARCRPDDGSPLGSRLVQVWLCDLGHMFCGGIHRNHQAGGMLVRDGGLAQFKRGADFRYFRLVADLLEYPQGLGE